MPLARFSDLFPVWAILLSGCALVLPSPFAAAKGAITPLLGVVMLGMGLTLTPESFGLVLRRPRVVLVGTAMQFLFMPAIAWLVARLLALPPMLTAGLVLVGACPGGTASNVITFLARGDVALSITLTSASTLLAVLATPLLSLFYLRQMVDVPALEMLTTVLGVVILPVAVGVALNAWAGARLARFRPWFPALSVIAIVVIIAILVGLVRDRIAALGPTVLVAIALHNGIGLTAGFWAGRALGFSPIECRTLAIEVGMQNSGLGVALAAKYFAPVAALPGALFSVWHNLTGSALASYWSRRNTEGRI
jgi:BASS family bile acid:Na+ symporter